MQPLAGLECLVERIVLADPELHRALGVELAIQLQVLDYVDQEMGSLGLDPDRVMNSGSPMHVERQGRRERGREGGREGRREGRGVN